MKKTIKKIGEYLIYLILILLLFYISFYFAFNTLASNSTVKIFGFKFYSVLTDSMEPVINVNDIVLATKKPIEEIEVGDKVAVAPYFGKDTVFVHYVESITYKEVEGEEQLSFKTHPHIEEGEEMKVDNWDIIDKSYIGVVKDNHVIKGLGQVLRFVTNIYTILLVLIVILLITLRNTSKKKSEYMILEYEYNQKMSDLDNYKDKIIAKYERKLKVVDLTDGKSQLVDVEKIKDLEEANLKLIESINNLNNMKLEIEKEVKSIIKEKDEINFKVKDLEKLRNEIKGIKSSITNERRVLENRTRKLTRVKSDVEVKTEKLKKLKKDIEGKFKK